MERTAILIPEEKIYRDIQTLLSGRVSVIEWRALASFDTHAWMVHEGSDFARILFGAPYELAPYAERLDK